MVQGRGCLVLMAAAAWAAALACGDGARDGGGVAVGPGGEAEGPAFDEAPAFAHRAGEVALARSGCTHCHAAVPAALARLRPLAAPDLTHVGARATPEWLRAFLDDPHAAADARMPDLLHGLAAGERAAAIEDLTHFLVAQGGPFAVEAARAEAWRIEEGERLFRTRGCLACHQDGLAGRDLARKTDLPKLERFLRDPHAARPSGAMPGMQLDARESQAIAAWLLRAQHARGPSGSALGPGVEYRYFEIEEFPESLAAFDGLEPLRSGHAEVIGLTPPHRDDQFAYEFEGMLRVPESGRHELYLNSDDGSRLWIDGELVVDHDGLHGPEVRTGSVDLEAGAHALRMRMFEASGGASLEAGWMTAEGPRPFTAEDLVHERQRYDPIDFAPWEPDPRRVARGRERFGRLGCAQCHVRVGADEAAGAPSTPAATPLSRIEDLHGGCLSDDAPPPSAPRFPLTDAEREDLRAVLARADDLTQPLEPRARVAHAMARLQCFACHARNGEGGAPPEVSAHFTGDGDLGDEGRIPPDLTDAGARLREEWIAEVLLGDARARPYLHARMPSYGDEAVIHLPAAFAAADAGAFAHWDVDFDEERLEEGRRLVGVEGFACVGCHAVAGQASLGMPGPDLATTWERLRPGYFRAWLRDPVGLRPGTRMPAFFSAASAAGEDATDAAEDADARIAAIWNYLSLGEAMPLPAGLTVDAAAYELVPVERPIYCGVFMQGLSPQVLCVGFPEKVHVAFDMHHVRLARVWKGDFLNAEGTWEGRAGQLEEPAGTDVLDLPEGGAVALLEDPAAAWPTQTPAMRGWQWGGHERGAEGRPTFRSFLPDADPTAAPRVEVEETLAPRLRAGGAVLERNLRVRVAPGTRQVFVRASIGADAIPVAVPDDGAWHEVTAEVDW